MADSQGTTPTRPMLRVVRGDASPEEVAALVAALLAATPAPRPEPRRSGWANRAAGLRGPLAVGPDAWRRPRFSTEAARTRADW